MDKSLLTELLCAILAAMLLWAAVVDIRTRTIANRLNLAIALMAPLFWYATGTELWPDAAIRVGVAIAVFLLFALAFQIGAMGGGDVKLAAALALWFAPARHLAADRDHVAGRRRADRDRHDRAPHPKNRGTSGGSVRRRDRVRRFVVTRPTVS